METTRQTILRMLRHQTATVDDLTSELGLAPATVRRHLDILARDGHIDVTHERQKTGRPRYIYAISEKGEELFPKHYVRMTNRLIEEIVALSPAETEGRGGRQLADLLFERMAERMAQKIAPRIYGASLGDRVRATTEALADEGIVFDVEERDGGYLLIGHGCPCPRALAHNGPACVHDQRLLSLLLAADVSYIAPASVGREGFCAYHVRQPNGLSPEDAAGLPEARQPL